MAGTDWIPLREALARFERRGVGLIDAARAIRDAARGGDLSGAAFRDIRHVDSTNGHGTTDRSLLAPHDWRAFPLPDRDGPARAEDLNGAEAWADWRAGFFSVTHSIPERPDVGLSTFTARETFRDVVLDGPGLEALLRQSFAAPVDAAAPQDALPSSTGPGRTRVDDSGRVVRALAGQVDGRTPATLLDELVEEAFVENDRTDRESHRRRLRRKISEARRTK